MLVDRTTISSAITVTVDTASKNLQVSSGVITLSIIYICMRHWQNIHDDFPFYYEQSMSREESSVSRECRKSSAEVSGKDSELAWASMLVGWLVFSESQCASNIASFGTFGCEAELTSRAVKEIAVSDAEGRSSPP
jgi:hypothetical protein